MLRARPGPVTLAGDSRHQDWQVVLPASLDGEAQGAVLPPRQLHRPEAGLHVVGVLVLPDVELLPLQRDVVRAELDPAGLRPTLPVTDTDQPVVELPEKSFPGALHRVKLRHCLREYHWGSCDQHNNNTPALLTDQQFTPRLRSGLRLS